MSAGERMSVGERVTAGRRECVCGSERECLRVRECVSAGEKECVCGSERVSAGLTHSLSTHTHTHTHTLQVFLVRTPAGYKGQSFGTVAHHVHRYISGCFAAC